MKTFVDVNKIKIVVGTKLVEYEENAGLINANGVVTSSSGGNGFVIYDSDSEFFLALNPDLNPSFPRWQSVSYPATVHFKTPKKGILTYYTSTQTVDGANTGRVCTHWILKGYEKEADCLADVNAFVLDEYIVPTISLGSTVTRFLNNTHPFQYYSLTMVDNHAKNGSHTSLGVTRFYMRAYNPHSVKKYLLAK